MDRLLLGFLFLFLFIGLFLSSLLDFEPEDSGHIVFLRENRTHIGIGLTIDRQLP